MVAHTPLAGTLTFQGRRQTWLAERLTDALGRLVYKQEVSRWALGTVTPEPATREAIAEILGVAVCDLFPAHGSGVSPTTPGADDGVGTRKAA